MERQAFFICHIFIVIINGMNPPFDHNKLLTKIAKEKLKPYGIVQKGKSRTFLYDNGWYIIVIEFQPSSWSKGTYLNLGVDFNFSPREHLAFGHGYREKGFEEAKDEKQFTDIVSKYCDIAIGRVEKLKKDFNDIGTAIRTIKGSKTKSAWDNFDLGVMYGIMEKFGEAKKYFTRLKKEKCEHPYEFARRTLAIEILTWLEDGLFGKKVLELIAQTRELKKLPLKDVIQLKMPNQKSKGFFSFWKKDTKD